MNRINVIRIVIVSFCVWFPSLSSSSFSSDVTVGRRIDRRVHALAKQLHIR